MKKFLNNYLKTESLLRSFFDSFNYCSSCPRKENLCCKDDNYNYEYREISDILDYMHKMRIEFYGPPLENTGGCGYLSQDGCVLKTHKNPICILWTCKDFQKHMFREGVRYDLIFMNRLEKSLINVLKGDLFGQDFEDFYSRTNTFLSKKNFLCLK